jgi:hypothetical protein
MTDEQLHEYLTISHEQLHENIKALSNQVEQLRAEVVRLGELLTGKRDDPNND